MLTSAWTFRTTITQAVMLKVLLPAYVPRGADILTVAAIVGVMTLPVGTHITTSSGIVTVPVPEPAVPFASV